MAELSYEDAIGGGGTGAGELSYEDALKPSAATSGKGFWGSVGEIASDLGKRVAGSAIHGVAATPYGLEQAAKGAVRGAVTGGADAVMPAGIYQPGLDTDESIFGPETDQQKSARDLAGERAASSIPAIPGAAWLEQKGKQAQEAIHKTTSEATQRAVENSQVTGNIFKGEIDFGADPSVRGYVMQASDVFGTMLPSMLTTLVTKNPAIGGMVGGAQAASEGATEARAFIEEKTHEQLYQESPYYVQMLKGGATPTQARKLTADRGAESAALLQGIVGGAGDFVTGKLITGQLNNVIGKVAGKSVIARGVTGGLLSSLEQGGQEVGEGVAADIGMKSVVRSKEIGEDSAGNLVLGALGGGGPGSVQGVRSAVGERMAARQKQGGQSITYEQAQAATQEAAAPEPAALEPATQATVTQPSGSGDLDYATYDTYRTTLESGGDPNAKAGTSSATGLHQFTKGTWLNTVKKAQPAWAAGLSDAELLALRTDAAKSTEMVKALDAENMARLKQAKQPVTAHNLYAAHHFGGGRAIDFARAGPDVSMNNILSAEQIKANSYLDGKTKAEAIAIWDARAAKAGVTVDGGANMAATPTAQQDADSLAPAQRVHSESTAEPDAAPELTAEQTERVAEIDQETESLTRRQKALQDQAYGQIFDTERAAIAQELADLRAERDEMTSTRATPEVAAGVEAQAAPAPMQTPQATQPIESEAAALQARQQTAEPVLQNRDRASKASIDQMNAIAADPDYMMAGQSRSMDTGAPVVVGALPASGALGKTETVVDGKRDRIQVQYAVVEAGDILTSNQADGTMNRDYATGRDGAVRAIAGNARSAGLTAAYERGTAGNYRAEMEADTDAHGIPADVIRGMKNPVLVRVMNAADIKADAGDRSNIGAAARLSPAEEASNDARRIDVGAIDFGEDGMPAANSVLGFVQAMPVTERNAMLMKDGRPSKQAVDRLMAATFKAAYDSDALTELYAAAQDQEARTVMAGIARAAGAMSKLDGAGEFDIRSLVTEAAQMAVNAVRNNQKLADWARNMDLDVSPGAAEVARFFAENIRSSAKIADGLRAWAGLALEQAQAVEQNAMGAGMFGDIPTLTREQLIERLTTDGNDNQISEPGDAGRPVAAAQDAEGRADRRTRESSGQEDGAIDGAVTAQEGAQGAVQENRQVDGPARADAAAGGERSEGLATRQETADDLTARRAEAVGDFKAAMADLADIATKNQRAAVVPENTPELMPTLVRLFDAAIRIVGTDARAATRWVQARLRANPDTKRLVNKIEPTLYRQAAQQALAAADGQQDGLFATASEAESALSAYTEADLRQRDADRQQADTKDKQDQQAAERKADADAQRGEFTLTGSDRAVDVAEAYGQQTFLSRKVDPAAVPDPTEAQRQYREAERAYGGKVTYDKAKADGRTKLTYPQWVQVRTPNFRAMFGDWEALRAQQRLDAMAPVKVNVPAEWRGLDHAALRERMAQVLDNLVRNKAVIQHPELGAIKVGREGYRKTEHSARDPAKSLVAADLENTLPQSILARSEPSRGGDGPDIDGYSTLLARVDVDGIPLVAAFTVRHQSDGKWYYNAVTLHDGQEKTRDSYGRPDRQDGSRFTPIAGLDQFSRRTLERVNPDTVTKAVDPETGEPLMQAKMSASRRIGLGGQSLDSLTVAEYLETLDNRSSRPESPSDNSPDANTNDTGEAQNVRDLVQRWESRGIKADLSERGDVINVGRIVVPKDQREVGVGTQAMNELTALADRLGKHIALTPSADFGGNVKRLREFYKRFGFIENKGKNRAFSTSHSMYRQAPDKTLFSRKDGITPEQRAANLEAFRAGATVVPWDGASEHEFKTGQSVMVDAFHGTARPDRVGEVFDRKRATSGPMAYFTSAPDLASNYAQGKQDTSLTEADLEFGNWFKVKVPGQRKSMPVDRAWNFLDADTKAKVAERMGDIRMDDDGNVIYEKGGGDLGNYQWELQQTQRGWDKRGNPLKAAIESWLSSGSLYDSESQFMDVLRLAGMPMNQVEFDSPNASYPFVYKTHIRMGNPLVTTDIPQSVRDALNDAAKRDRSRPKYQQGVDSWDKNTRTLREWVEAFNDQSDQASFVWTSIPDKVTDVFKSLGYDGIIDKSNKSGSGPAAHPVYIPFVETQVKSALGNRGTYDPAKKNIMMSRGTGQGAAAADAQAMADRVAKALPNMPKVHVLQSTREAPPRLRAYLEQQGAMDDAEGAFHAGELYLFADNLASMERAEHVLATHEAGHAGLAGMLGADKNRVMQSLLNQNDDLNKQARAEARRLGVPLLTAVEEVLVDMKPADLAKLAGWRKVVHRVQRWLERSGFTELARQVRQWMDGRLSDQQRADMLAADLMFAAHDYLAGRGGPRDAAGAAPVTALLGRSNSQVDVQQEVALSRAEGGRAFDGANSIVVSDFRNDAPMKRHQDYRSAKAGDAEAAVRLVRDLVKPESIEKARDQFGADVTFAPVHAVEAGGMNKLPNALAMMYADALGASVDQGITQSNKAFHTGAGPMERLMNRAEFDGAVEPGKSYVLVDDVTTMGSTLADMAAYIQRNGGRVVGTVVLVNAARGGKIEASPKVIKQLEARHGQAIREILGIGADQLTGPEADYLVGFKSADEIRGRATKAGQERIARLDAKALPERSPGVEPKLSRATTPTAGQAQQPIQTPAQRAESLIRESARTLAPLEVAFHALTKYTGVEKATKAIGGLASRAISSVVSEKIKAGLVSDYGLDQRVRDERVLMQSRQQVQMRQAGKMIDSLASLTREESAAAYRWMNETDPAAIERAISELPADSIEKLRAVQQAIDSLSQDAVDLGQLDKRSYERNKFAYLHRSYAKHILDQKGAARARGRAITILGNQYKGRGTTATADMNKVKQAAPGWWDIARRQGKADPDLTGKKLTRYDRVRSIGSATAALEGFQQQGDGRVLDTVWLPADQPVPQQYAEWRRGDTFEVRGANGNQLQMWRDWTATERKKMGEIDEVRFAIAKTLHGMIRDVEAGRFLKWISRHHSVPTDAQLPAGASIVEASESLLRPFMPGEWVQVPAVKVPGTQVAKYGALAGKWVEGPIWNEVRQAIHTSEPFGRVYGTILNAWKLSKTALSPTVHINNVMSNFVMADWHDVTAGHVAKALRIIMGAHGKDSHQGAIGAAGKAAKAVVGMADQDAAREVMKRYSDSGAELGSWVINEAMRNQVEPLLAAMEDELQLNPGSVAAQAGVMSALQLLRQKEVGAAAKAMAGAQGVKQALREGKNMIDLYQSEDSVFRLAAWLKAKEEGKSDIEAGRIARYSFMDYNINAPWIQAARKTMLPFLAYTYRAAPMLLDVAMNKPHKIIKLMAVAGALNALGTMLAGGADDDEVRRLLPDEKAGDVWGMVPKLIRMPWDDKSGSPVFLDIRRWIPMGDVFDLGQGHGAMPIPPAVMPGGPLALGAEVMLNKSSFTGKPIVLETDTAAQQARKLAEYLYKWITPNVLGLPGSYATTGVLDAMKGRTDAFGRERSVPQSIASSVGVKLASYPSDILRRNIALEAAGQEAELKRGVSQLARQLSTKSISREEYDQAVAVEIDKLRKLGMDTRERLYGR